MAECYHRETTASGRCADCGADQHGRNSHVVAAFKAGNVTIDRNGNTREPRDLIRSGNGNLASVRAGTGRNDLGNGRAAPITFLQSYGVTIAIRRDSDGAIFLNGHAYSPSTGRHQREAGASWRDGVSFPALEALLGPTWYETARIMESAPQSCISEHCERLHKEAVDAWTALRVQTGTRTRRAHGYECSDDCPTPCPHWQAWHVDASGASHIIGARTVTEPEFAHLDATGAPVEYPERRCLFVDIERETSYSRERKLEEQGSDGPQDIPADIMQRGQHELTGDGTGQAFTLLETSDPINPTGAHVQVICGFESGRRARRGSGRTDQLWAAICPRMVNTIPEALESLNPFSKGTRTATGHRREDAVSDVKRQGDLFFAPFAGECPCPCHSSQHSADETSEREQDRTEALRRAGILNMDGALRARHGCTRAGENAPQLCKRRDCPPVEAQRIDGLELPDAGGRHVATRAAIDARNNRFAQGAIEHPEHPTLRLKTWHRVGRSLATRAMSAAYRQGWTGGRGYAD